MIRTDKTVYDKPEPSDGERILVMRLWPRGVSKEKVDLWLREISPSDELRKWYSHDSTKWPAFRARYAGELADKKDLVERVRKLETRDGTVTLLFSSKEVKYNNAVALGIILGHAERGADHSLRS